jgi:hypothetical protein
LVYSFLHTLYTGTARIRIQAAHSEAAQSEEAHSEEARSEEARSEEAMVEEKIFVWTVSMDVQIP